MGSNKEIIVIWPDKGRGVVLLDKDKYVEKLCRIISDKIKFSGIKEPIQVYSMRVEDKIINFLSKLKNVSFEWTNLQKSFYYLFRPWHSLRFAQSHKADFADSYHLRPIFAAYNCASYKLSKFLVPVLSPFATNDYTVDNFFTFCQKISAVQNANNLSMTSFDVENLFTNISGPLHETITICLDYLFPDGSSNVLGLSRKLFKILLELSVLNLFLLFNSKLFRQT